MSIRLNKAIRELNIGLQTAVEFLEKKPNLGEVKGDPNFKLSDAQYEALATQFNKDKQVKAIADKKFPKKSKEGGKKKQSQGGVKRGDDGLTKIQAYTPLGKIDLDQLNRKPGQKTDQKPKADQAKAKEEKPVRKQEPQQPKQEQPKPAQKEAAPQHKAEPKAEKPAVKEQPKETAHKEVAQKPAAQKENAQKENKEQAKPAAKAVETEQKPAKPAKSEKAQPAAAAQTETAQKEGKEQEPATTEGGAPFQTQNEKKLLNQPKLNVLGKLDLSTINQNTRPKKKSKEERRKEREEKNGQGKKKRVRINKERVDINAAANQQPAQQGKKQGQQQQQGQADGGGKRKKKNRGRSNKPLEVDDEAVARQVKETLARLTSKTQNKKGAKYRKEKRDAAQEKLNQEARAERKQSKTLKLTEFVTVSELATMMDVPVTKVISTLMSVGIMVSINQRLDAETINLVADEFGFSTEYVSAEVQEAVSEEADDENDLVPRAPIVTVMGHVDHGKTSLLDHIRNTNVIAGEAGGITQHIGAYSVTLKNGSKVTFLDTPGHEAFTAMRARGAQVTDIAIIIIAADDSVMPTTKEAIAHAQAAGVPMVFAINKIDKPGANPDKIREQLSNMNILVEDWGGKYQCQEISAKKGINVDLLLDKVLLEADMLDLKANPNRRATGAVIESSLDKGRGYLATVLVQNGTMRVGDVMLSGCYTGRVKAMFNERGQKVDEAGPSTPVSVLGLNGAPTAGETFNIMADEREAKEIANKREQLIRIQGIKTQKHMTLEEIGRRIAIGNFKELNVIVKGDVDGSVEALSDSLIKLSTEEVRVNVIHKAVGAISESDVLLAAASDAVIIGFQVRPSTGARKLAEKEEIEIRLYSVIYDAINEVKDGIEGMLAPEEKEEITATAEVLETFKISKVGTIAGAIVREGKLQRTSKIRVIRDGIVVYTGELGSLKRFKDDVKEVVSGQDCGLNILNYNDIKVGDIVEAYQVVEVKRTL